MEECETDAVREKFVFESKGGAVYSEVGWQHYLL